MRSDLVQPVELRRYAWVLLPHKQRAPVAGWLLDERTHTFTVVADDGTPQVGCCRNVAGRGVNALQHRFIQMRLVLLCGEIKAASPNEGGLYAHAELRMPHSHAVARILAGQGGVQAAAQ